MIKRTIEISSEPAHLTVRLGQLVLFRDERTIASIPCEDIGVVLVDQQQATYSHAALAGLAESDAVLVVCGRDHLPAAVLLPLADHSQVVWRVSEQVAIRKPLRKQLWRQLVRAKIRAQAANLPEDGAARRKLVVLAQNVRSGDPENIEAQAARVYWQNWLPDERFRRDFEAPDANALLNYGYAVIRASMARALVAAGLLPALGLFHHNRSNAFCLADDLIEPLRPLVDRRVRDLWREGHRELKPGTKAGLLALLAEPVRLGGVRGPLMVNLQRMVASLVRCYQGEADRLEIPQGMYISGYRCMWVVAMFDLPVNTKKARRAYADFVKFLKRDGFTRMQFSIYARHSASKENAEVHVHRIQGNLPPDGEVRILTVTDKQYERMSVFWGNSRKTPEEPPCQLSFF